MHSLAPKAKKLKMPLVTEVREIMEYFAEKQSRNFNSLVIHFYPVHDCLEKSFMTVRDVPQEVIT